MSDEKWFTVSELLERFGIPQPTTRRYIERHGHHLHTKKHHKSYLISEESIPVLVRIREGYAEGMNADQVETLLAASGAPTIITVNDTSDQSGERVSVDDLLDRFKRQEEFNQLLVKTLERQHQEDRDKIDRLMELVIQQQETAAAALLDPVQQRHERVNDRLTERRIENQLRAEALDLWAAKPEAERLRKVSFLRKEENILARDRFVQDYVDEHYEYRLKGKYDL